MEIIYNSALYLFTQVLFTLSASFRIHWLYPLSRGKTPTKNNMGITLNCIYLWGSCPGYLGSVVYHFFAISLSSILTCSGSTCSSLSMWQINLFANYQYRIGIPCNRMQNLLWNDTNINVCNSLTSRQTGWQAVKINQLTLLPLTVSDSRV